MVITIPPLILCFLNLFLHWIFLKHFDWKHFNGFLVNLLFKLNRGFKIVNKLYFYNQLYVSLSVYLMNRPAGLFLSMLTWLLIKSNLYFLNTEKFCCSLSIILSVLTNIIGCQLWSGFGKKIFSLSFFPNPASYVPEDLHEGCGVNWLSRNAKNSLAGSRLQWSM